MWKAWRRESQQRVTVDCFWRRLCAAQAAGIESQVLILVTHPSAPQAIPIKSTCGKMIGFTQHSVIITPLRTSDDVNRQRLCNNMRLYDFLQYLTKMALFPKNEDIFCFVCLTDYNNPQPHTRGSVMHMQPRTFTQPVQSTFPVYPVNHCTSTHTARPQLTASMRFLCSSRPSVGLLDSARCAEEFMLTLRGGAVHFLNLQEQK